VENGSVSQRPDRSVSPGKHIDYNGGIYKPDGDKYSFRGVVCYHLGDNVFRELLVVYFELDRCGLAVKDNGTPIDANLVDEMSREQLTHTIMGARYSVTLLDLTSKSDPDARTANISFSGNGL